MKEQKEKVFAAFLRGSRTAHFYNFIYADDGASNDGQVRAGVESWDLALDRKSSYYIFRNEADLISNKKEEIAGALLPSLPLIELGVGSPKAVHHKTIPLLNALNPSLYVANDLSQKSIDSARALIQTHFPSIKTEGCKGDFLLEETPLLKHAGSNVFLAGSTVSNIAAYDGKKPIAAVVDYLKKIRRLLGKSGSLIITQDTNQDPTSLKPAYDTPEMNSFFSDAFQRMKSGSLVNSFNAKAFRFEPVWNPECNLLTSTFLCTKDQTVEIDGEAIHLPAGRRLYLANSYKYPAQDFLHMARIAGLEPVRAFMDAQDRVALHVLRPTS